MEQKIISFFWEGKKLSWLRYLTIYSFRKYNPDWIINIYTSSGAESFKLWKSPEKQDFFCYTGKDYSHLLEKMNINIIEYNYTEKYKITPSQKSNFFKWNLLANNKSFYSDFDILYVRNIDDLFNISLNYSAGLTYYYNYFSIGFMFSNGNSALFKDIYKNCTKLFSCINYQGAGVEILKKMNINWDSLIQKYKDVYNIPFNLLYKYHSNIVKKIYEKNSSYLFDSDAIGLHWYAGHPISQEFNNYVNETNYNKINSLISRTISRILHDD